MSASNLLLMAYVPVLVSTIYGTWIYRSLIREYRILAGFIFFTGIIQLGGRICASQKINNFPLLHLYVVLGGVLLILFYGSLFRNFVQRNLFIGLALAYLILTVANSLLIQPVFTFNSYALVLEAIMIVVLSLSCFVLTLRHGYFAIDPERIMSWNWINSGLFLYFSGNLVLYYFGKQIVSSQVVNEIWIIHAALSSIMQGCFIVGLWVRPQA